MSAPTDLYVLLRLYTNKQNSPTVLIQDFCDYLQKYARHYLQEAPDLVMYLEDTATTVQKELEHLQDEAKLMLTTDVKGHKFVFVPQFLVDRIIQRYKELDEHTELPFPVANELPSEFPASYLKPLYITTDFGGLIEEGERTNSYLFQLIFPDDTPPMIYPASLSPEKLLDLSLAKIRLFLRKDESKDYIQKRMMLANPGKEMTIKNHLMQFQTRPTESLSAFKHSGDAYAFWSNLCSFIRQDYAKKNEKTPEEAALIQSIFIAEFLNDFYRNKTQQSLQRETALKNLELCFQKPPYYYDMDAITKFTDSRGVPLLGQYRSVDLEQFIREKSGDSESSLPPLLIFKPDSGKRFFILKEKVVPLVLRLCNETRKTIKDLLTHEWFELLSSYRYDEAMNSPNEYEKKIEGMCRTTNPILHALLSASFIPLLALEGSDSNDKDTPHGFRMFDHGRLLPYNVLLMLDRQEILTDSRILLPFWFTIPILSAIIRFFRRPRKKKTPSAGKKVVHQNEALEELDSAESKSDDAHDAMKQRKIALKRAVEEIEKRLISEGSTLEKELGEQLDLWNRNLDPGIKKNLTEDVNSLIRDYIRKTVKSIKVSTFDRAWVENLTTTLVDSPGLAKIKNREALTAYVQLYIIHLIKNIN